MSRPDDLQHIGVLARLAATRSVIDHARNDLDEMMIEAYNLGVTSHLIADAAGIARASLYRYLDQRGIERRQPKRDSPNPTTP